MSKKWIDKKSATTYNLVHRPYNDPLAHDEEAGQSVLMKVDNLNDKDQKQARKDKWTSGPGPVAPTPNRRAGEAAMYGIGFDDSNYDYMQHLKPMGLDDDAVFVGKDGKTSLATDAAGPKAKSEAFAFKDDADLPEEMFQSRPQDPASQGPAWKAAYQAQQALPDELKGLQPDMDPRLREVLEALEDEEYVENNDEALFDELMDGGAANDVNEWKQSKPKEQVVRKADENDWEYEFRKYKQEQNADDSDAGEAGSDIGSDFGSDFGSDYSNSAHPPAPASEQADTLGALPSIKKPKKKRIGAKTDLTGFSMSSSANYRNEGLTLLDDQFDKIEQEYAKPEESDEEQEFDMSKERGDLDSIMDDFLSNYAVQGKKLWRK